MRYLSHPNICRRLSDSFPLLVACLALPAASAQAAGLERTAHSLDDSSAQVSNQPPSPVTVKNASGVLGDAIPLVVTVSTKPGQSVLSTYLVGLPKGAGLTDTEHAVTATDEKAAIDVTHWNLPRLTVMLPPTQAGTYTIAVVAASRPGNDGPMTFTTSTFVLKAAPENREKEPVAGTAVLGAKRPDAADMRETLRLPLTALPSALPPSNKAVQVSGATPYITTPATEVTKPKTLVNLWQDEKFSEAAAQLAVAPPSLVDRRGPELRSTASATPSTLAVPPVAAPVAVAPAAASPALATDADGKAMVERAERLIRLGDISGARLVLERASDRGDPRATFLLAQTCDPRMLREWKVQGLRADPDRARALYAKAAQEGVRENKPVTEAKR